MPPAPDKITHARALMASRQFDRARALLLPLARRPDPVVDSLLAQTFEGLQEVERALFYARRAYDAEPGHDARVYEYGRMLAATGHFEEGIPLLARAAALAPRAHAPRISLASAHLDRGDYAG